MSSFHILTRLRGDHEVDYALLHVTPELITRIADSRQTVTAYFARHCTHGSIKDLSDVHIDFLRGIPEIPCLAIDPEDYLDDPIRLDGLDHDAFIAAAEAQELYARSELTGLVIGTHLVHITGYQKHCDDRVDSDDILPLLQELLDAAAPPLSPLESLHRIAATISDIPFANGNSDPDVMAEALDSCQDMLAQIRDILDLALPGNDPSNPTHPSDPS